MMSSKRNQWKSAHFDVPNVAWNPCCAKLSYFEKQGKNSFRPNKNMECGGHIFCKKVMAWPISLSLCADLGMPKKEKKIKVTYSLRPLIHMQNKFNGFSLPFLKKSIRPTARDSSLERKGFAKFQRKRRKNLFFILISRAKFWRRHCEANAKGQCIGGATHFSRHTPVY